MTFLTAEFLHGFDRWGRTERSIISSAGCEMQMRDGHTITSLTSGLWNAPLGFGHVGIANAVHKEMLDNSCAPLFRRGSCTADRASSALLEYTDFSYECVLYSTSGGAALDSSARLARFFWFEDRPRRYIVSLRGSYHGTITGAMALTGEDFSQESYGAQMRSHLHVEPNDISGLDDVFNHFGSQIAAIVVEPLLGSGAVPLDSEFVDKIFGFRKLYGTIVIADEVATGFWRTGQKFRSGGWSEVPDIMILSKALTNGTMASSAILLGARVSSVLSSSKQLFLQAETQAGSPQSCGAIVASIEAYREPWVRTRVGEISAILDSFCDEIEGSQLDLHSRGEGLFRWIGGSMFDDLESLDAGAVDRIVSSIYNAGVEVYPGPQGIQILPPFIIADDILHQSLNVVRESLNAVK